MASRPRTSPPSSTGRMILERWRRGWCSAEGITPAGQEIACGSQRGSPRRRLPGRATARAAVITSDENPLPVTRRARVLAGTTPTGSPVAVLVYVLLIVVAVTAGAGVIQPGGVCSYDAGAAYTRTRPAPGPRSTEPWFLCSTERRGPLSRSQNRGPRSNGPPFTFTSMAWPRRTPLASCAAPSRTTLPLEHMSGAVQGTAVRGLRAHAARDHRGSHDRLSSR